MEVFFEVPDIQEETTIAIGTFDGLHLGHQSVLKEAKNVAQKNNQPLLVFTFMDHPAIITGSKKVPQLLTTSEEKINLLSNYGIDYCVMLNFTKEISVVSPEDFVENFLVKKLNAKNICIGFNFFFGHKAAGSGETLKQLSSKYGYFADVIGPVKLKDQTVSSSLIRGLLGEGQIEKANELLNYNYYLKGKVVRGKGIGKAVLGIPTANIAVSERKQLPQNGVYSCDVRLHDDNKVYTGVANLGNRPTFDNGDKSIEVHILDFDSDIYDQQIEVNFKKYIRSEKKFDGIEALKQQILADIELARQQDNLTQKLS